VSVVRVYVDMVGDLFHAGHVAMLERARALGDELLVGVCDDETTASYKRTPVLTTRERVAVIRACRYVDDVWEACPLRLSRADIDERRIDIVVHGDDWSAEALRDYYGVPMDMGILRVLPSTPWISTSMIIGRVIARADELAPNARLP
jgi:cytidyltransferase-like protein